jgi:hypothetical protein
VSSNTITPLQSRLHPCSGKEATTLAASRSMASADGQEGWCWHMAFVFRQFFFFRGVPHSCGVGHMNRDARYQAKRRINEQVIHTLRRNQPFGRSQ